MKLKNIDFEGGLVAGDRSLQETVRGMVAETLSGTPDPDEPTRIDPDGTDDYEPEPEMSLDDSGQRLKKLEQNVGMLGARNDHFVSRLDQLTTHAGWMTDRMDNVEQMVRQMHDVVTKPGLLARLIGKKGPTMPEEVSEPWIPKSAPPGDWEARAKRRAGGNRP